MNGSPEDKKILQGKFEYWPFDNTKKLGSGSFATVYKGINNQTGEQLAIKKIDLSKLEKYGNEIFKAIGNEVNILLRISKNISSPYIIKIFDCFKTSTSIYIVLEYCNGGTLNDILKKKKTLPEEEAKEILFQIVKAIEILAINNIAHRDIKPENIFINDGVYKLGDFGFASQKNLYDTQLGTFPYMAPEMFLSDDYDQTVDVWALGVMYHEMLFGELYFSGINTAQVQKNICQKPYIVISIKVPSKIQISNESKNILTSALQKDPKQRITAIELLKHPLFCNSQDKFQSIKKSNSPIQQPKENQQFLELYKIYDTRILITIADKGILNFPLEMRFCSFFILKKALFDFRILIEQMAQNKFPDILFTQTTVPQMNNQKWFEFHNSSEYQEIFQQINNQFNDFLNQQFENYFNELSNFIFKNFKEQVFALQTIVNNDLQKNVPNDIFNNEIVSKLQEFQNNKLNLQRNPMQRNECLQIMLGLNIILNVDQLMKNNFNFSKYFNLKDKLGENGIMNIIQTQSYHQFLN